MTIKRSVHLRRTLTLPLVTLYGLGTTVGAGIYVLIGVTAAEAGTYAPAAFVLAALVMLPTACSFAELVGRLPVSAGEAAYVRAAFGSRLLSTGVGLGVVLAGVVSASAIARGSVGYIQEFVPLSDWLIIFVFVAVLGGIAAWGILQSVGFAATLTVIEVVGLLFVIGSGMIADPGLIAKIPSSMPPFFDATKMAGVWAAALLAFFAFIGFEDLVNVAEETKRPGVLLPRAIFLTLGLTTLLYVLVALVAVHAVPPAELGRTDAPLSLVFERVTGAGPGLITGIAIIATFNGAVVQIIMAARVIYGLSRSQDLPAKLGEVSPRTQTPLYATALVTVIILLLALLFPVRALAELTARVTLVIFIMVNAGLLTLKYRGERPPADIFEVWNWVPIAGIVCCLLLLAADLV